MWEMFKTRLSHTSDGNIDILVPAVLYACCCMVNTGTGWPCICVLCGGKTANLTCSFYLRVEACTTDRAYSSLRRTLLVAWSLGN